MLFQPMFDERLKQSRVNEPVPSATEFNAQVVPPEEPIHKDTLIIHDVLHPSHNLVTRDPGSAQSSSRNVNSAEHIKVNYPPDHLRRWTKDHPLDNIIGNPSRPVSTRKQLASDALWCCFHTELSKVEPKNFKMAVIEDCWFQAMQDEIHEFDRLEVWELVPRPIYVMVIALKWIYKVKLDEYGDVLKNKARLVAKGYRQEEALYGLKQAPRAWYDTLLKFLMANNFFKGAVDPTLFTRKSGKHILIVQIYVDEIILQLNRRNACNIFSKEMSSKFQMSMMGQMSFFLGLQVSQSPGGIFINQAKYALETLKKYGMDLSDPVDTPMVDRLKLDEDLNGDHAGCQDSRRSTWGIAQFLGDRLNSMAEQNVPAQPPTRTDEQIVPRSQWLTIGKSNLLFNAQKIQKNPIFQISVDILKNTNFFQALTASANVPTIYLQQFWKT
ncbi:retrovirus-related pol polyprotein from transposon TNT 1-94, partial [Tanacetum coccineum]